MIFNKTTLTLELLTYYNQFWNQTFVGTPEAIERAKKENGERCIELTKAFFVGAISSIEFCTKESIKLHPSSNVTQTIIRLAGTKRIYLSNIIKESSNQGLITIQEKDKWDRLIWLRNLVVHNNGIADTDVSYIIDSVTLNLENGKMVQGKLDTFTKLDQSNFIILGSKV